jgi:Spy/CpxP family protein refolding chaperone
MKKTGCKATILVGLAVVFLAGVVFAGPHGRHRGGHGRDRGGWKGGHGRGMMLGRILRKLDLTDEQNEQIKAIREADREKTKDAREAVAETTKALHEAAFQDANEATIRAAATALGNALGDKAVLRATTMASIKKVLTAEQLEKLAQSRAKMKERVGQFRKGMRDPESCNRFSRGGGPRSRPRRGLNVEKLFETRDADKDGKLTKEELQAGGDKERPRRFEWLLEKADVDGDGALTVEELEAHKGKMRDRHPRQPRRGGWHHRW